MHGEPALLGGGDQRVGARARLVGCGEHAGDLVAARDKGFERGLAKGLLADDDDAHFVPSDADRSMARRAARASRRPAIIPAAEFHASQPAGKPVVPQFECGYNRTPRREKTDGTLKCAP